MLRFDVKARALIAAAASAPLVSACTRTLPKSCPKRGSMYPRVAASSGWPDERRTSLAIGGTVAVRLRPLPRCCGTAGPKLLASFDAAFPRRTDTRSMALPPDPATRQASHDRWNLAALPAVCAKDWGFLRQPF